ncbi:MAG: pentapeptide repeat-containing protein [Xenococcaceae cyanobacterium MO_188.B32]|nr:pentapeptide repeat-containing protein [Xenococcaceae cyanobacterium MO_188.B32]
MTNNRHLTLLKQDVKAWNCWRQENSRVNLDLSGTNLSNLNLSGVNLSGVNLSGVDLRKTNLKCAYLKGANLDRACLISANLNGSDLSEVDLTQADLTRADLSSADLTNANLTQVTALQTNFKKSILTGACLENWQINNLTNLEEIVCDYFYGKQEQQQRYPQDERQNFAPGEYYQIIRNNFNDSNYMDAIVIANNNSQSSVPYLEKKERPRKGFLRKGTRSDAGLADDRIPRLNDRSTVEQSDNLVEESIDDSWREESSVPHLEKAGLADDRIPQSENAPPKLIGSSIAAVDRVKQKKDSLVHLSIAFLLGIIVTILTFGQIFKQASTSSNSVINCDNSLLKRAEDAVFIQEEESLRQVMHELEEFNTPLGGFADEKCKQTLYKVQYVYAIHIKATKENNLLKAVKMLCELPEQFYQNRKHKPWFTRWVNSVDNPDFPQQLTEYLKANSCPAANYLNDNQSSNY